MRLLSQNIMEEKVGIGNQSDQNLLSRNEEPHTGLGAEIQASMREQLGKMGRPEHTEEKQSDPSQSNPPNEGERLSGLGADTHAMMESLRRAAMENQGSEASPLPNEDAQRAEALQSVIRDLSPEQAEGQLPEQEIEQVAENHPVLAEKKGFFSRLFQSKFFSWVRNFFPKR
jgi:hypothetical protein